MSIRANGQCFTMTFKAARDLSSYQYHPVYLSAADTVDYAGDNARVVGVLLNKPSAAGAAASVCVLGICPVVGAASISRGSYLQSNSSYQAAATTTDKDNLFGIALEATAAAGDIITMLVAPSMYAG